MDYFNCKDLPLWAQILLRGEPTKAASPQPQHSGAANAPDKAAAA